jgi:DNA-binding NtrC family response regulator
MEPQMAGLRILIVDDEQELVQALVERLKLRGFQAHGVTAGDEALEIIRSESFDVVLLDVKMPGLGGIELIKHIKRERPGLEVVMLTGHGSAKDAEEGKALGAFDYLMKPVKFESLLEILRAAAGKRARPE